MYMLKIFLNTSRPKLIWGPIYNKNKSKIAFYF